MGTVNEFHPITPTMGCCASSNSSQPSAVTAECPPGSLQQKPTLQRLSPLPTLFTGSNNDNDVHSDATIDSHETWCLQGLLPDLPPVPAKSGKTSDAETTDLHSTTEC